MIIFFQIYNKIDLVSYLCSGPVESIDAKLVVDSYNENHPLWSTCYLLDVHSIDLLIIGQVPKS